jgi:hypothetical protein
MKFTLHIILLVFVTFNKAHAQPLNYEWGRTTGSSGVDDAFGVAVDNAGNVFSCGRFQNTFDLDPTAGIDNVDTNGAYDCYIQKLDANGNYLWGFGFGGDSNDEAYSIAVDDAGNTYTTGRFQNTVDFEPGAGITNLTRQVIWNGFME